MNASGSVNLFAIFEPPHVGDTHSVTQQRTKKDFALLLKNLVDIHCPVASSILWIVDNLNTHNPAALYEVFPPSICTSDCPKSASSTTLPLHGSWLNQVEIELSVLSRQCLERRIADVQKLSSKIASWQSDRNSRACKCKLAL
ncbi:MAG: transposase [Tolypothrix carrinoi HA7290-LM1]|nr:transposase [Tolypothrix carrinoi HA7290-LM1]